MLFVLLLRNDGYGSSLMLSSGAAGGKDQAEAIQAFGGSVVSQLVTAGRYDEVIVADFPSVEACLAFRYSTTSTGQWVDVMAAIELSAMDTVRDLGLAVAEKQFAELDSVMQADKPAATGDD